MSASAKAARAWTLAAALLVLGAAAADALGLRSSKAEAFLGSVLPGESVPFAASGAPLSAENAGKEPLKLRVSALSPTRARLKDGYDPAPPGWASFAVQAAELAPGETAELGLVVRVPKDSALADGQYQLDAKLEAEGASGARLELKTAVLVAVGGADPPSVPPAPEDGTFTVSPAKASLEGIPLGRRTPARSRRFRALRLANAGTEEAVVSLSPARAWDESVRLEDGWTPAPNPRWLKVAAKVRVPPGRVADATFELEVPAQERYRNRRFAFVVAVDAEAGGRKTRRWWVLYVKTE